MRLLLLTALAALAIPLAADGKAAPPACRGGDLSGAFAVIPGLAGAGNIVYRLRVVNRSARTCSLSGLPALRLVDRRHRPLPTHVIPASRSHLVVLVRLAPGHAAAATARFSPDVPGPGEGGRRQCEPKAWAIRYRPNGGGTLLARVRPATPVCEHGTLQLSIMRPS